jgi:hypothetical protein
MAQPKSNKKAIKIVKKVPAKKAKKPESNHVYVTKIDEILDYVKNMEKATLEEISLETDLAIEEVELWLKILQKRGYVQIVYPMIGKPFAIKTGHHIGLPEENCQTDETKKRNLIIFAAICLLFILIGYYLYTVYV